MSVLALILRPGAIAATAASTASIWPTALAVAVGKGAGAINALFPADHAPSATPTTSVPATILAITIRGATGLTVANLSRIAASTVTGRSHTRAVSCLTGFILPAVDAVFLVGPVRFRFRWIASLAIIARFECSRRNAGFFNDAREVVDLRPTLPVVPAPITGAVRTFTLSAISAATVGATLFAVAVQSAAGPVRADLANRAADVFAQNRISNAIAVAFGALFVVAALAAASPAAITTALLVRAITNAAVEG